MSFDAVRILLMEELEDAKERHREAKEHFWEAAGKPRRLPRTYSGLPDMDSDLIRRALALENEAREVHLNALIRLNRFLIEGVVPGDLREREAPATIRTKASSA